jgi:hypothetical protein
MYPQSIQSEDPRFHSMSSTPYWYTILFFEYSLLFLIFFHWWHTIVLGARRWCAMQCGSYISAMSLSVLPPTEVARLKTTTSSGQVPIVGPYCTLTDDQLIVDRVSGYNEVDIVYVNDRTHAVIHDTCVRAATTLSCSSLLTIVTYRPLMALIGNYIYQSIEPSTASFSSSKGSTVSYRGSYDNSASATPLTRPLWPLPCDLSPKK